RRALYRHPLHIMFHTPDASHFFAATGTAGAAMDERRQRTSVAGTFFCAVIVENQDSTMMCGSAKDITARKPGVCRHDRTAERSFPFFRQLDDRIGIGIRHQRADGTESFDSMGLLAGEWPFVQQQQWAQEGALCRIAFDQLDTVQ